MITQANRNSLGSAINLSVNSAKEAAPDNKTTV